MEALSLLDGDGIVASSSADIPVDAEMAPATDSQPAAGDQ